MAKRKMTEAQREAAVSNLAKARAAKKPITYKNIAPNVLALPEDHGLSMINVKEYIKASKEKLSVLRAAVHRGEKGAIAKQASVAAYKRHCETYLRDGMWSLDFYGKDEEKKVLWKTIAPAYDNDGIQK
jgi:hypothetical protein